MTFDELLTKTKTMAAGKDASNAKDMSVQISATGSDGGDFYIIVKDGKVTVDEGINDECASGVAMSMKDMESFMAGKLNPMMAYMTGRIKVKGDIRQLIEFSKYIR